MRAFLASFGLACGLAITLATATAAQTTTRQTDALLDLLGLQETVEIMRDEGLSYAQELAADMLPARPGALWRQRVDAIYDTERMAEAVRDAFDKSFSQHDITTDRLERFFGSELGRDIIRLELSAREAMSDEAIEEAAREAYLDRADNDPEDDKRLAQVTTIVEANDLIEANVVGGMNTNIRFYQGLVDGGALEMSEDEILLDVWGSERATRIDTTEWIYAYLLMAYRPLSDGQLADYAALSQSKEGQAMTQALFAGFDEMYDDISYALGRALADQMSVQEL